MLERINRSVLQLITRHTDGGARDACQPSAASADPCAERRRREVRLETQARLAASSRLHLAGNERRIVSILRQQLTMRA